MIVYAYMKLVSVNVEGKRHLDKVFSFLEIEDPDTVCLQEAPIDITSWLKERGYRVTFLPLTLMSQDGTNFPQGDLFASKVKYEVDIFHYYQPCDSLPLFDEGRVRETTAKAVILAQIDDLLITTTHFTWTPNGEVPNKDQVSDIKKLFSFLDELPPHILCGDLNIPRNINRLYKDELMPRYIDAIPKKYESSLDKDLHRLGDDPEKSKLFESFMVDHLLLKESFIAQNVRLEFGVSDHAAIVADLVKDK